MLLILILEDLFFNGFIFFKEMFVASFQTYSFLQNKGEESINTNKIVCSKRETELPLWGLPRETLVYDSSLKVDEHYKESQLSLNETDFFDQLMSDMSDGDLKTANDLKSQSLVELEPLEQLLDDSYIEQFTNSKQDEETKDSSPKDSMLSMEDWTDKVIPVDISYNLSATANSTIGEYCIGEQLWVAEVIGEEQEYIHASDGSGRVWIDTKGFGNFRRGDILSLLVERKTEHIVKLLAAEILQEFSDDFSMLDEIEDFYMLNETENALHLSELSNIAQ